jgi:hypothetical protein
MPKRKYQKPLKVDVPLEGGGERFAQDDPKEVAQAAVEDEVGLPLRVIEEADTGHRFVVYTSKDGVEIDIRFDGSEPWFTQLQLAEMFGVDVRTVSGHIKKFLTDGELDDSVIRDFRITAKDGKPYDVKHYGLDAAFYVGYRVNSRQGMLFRRWATKMLVQVATKAFVVDVRRLENPDGRPDFFDELLEKIRHIRASEKRMWTRVLELASFCSDYGVLTDRDKQDFFATIQNALHWATTQHTAAEVIHGRADRNARNAGVTHFEGDMPTVAEGKVAKNYYSQAEIAALNLVTSLALEFFESQAEQRKPTTLGQFLGKMRDLLKLDGRPLIPENDRGRVSMDDAKKRATIEIKVFRDRVRLEREDAGEKALEQIASQVKAKRQRKANEPKKPEKKG